MPPAVQLILLVLTVTSALVWTAWPIHYHLTTGGRCWRTRHGRNLQGQSITIALLLDFSLVSSVVVPRQAPANVPEWLVTVALVLYGSLAYYGLDRHVLLWRDQHPAK